MTNEGSFNTNTDIIEERFLRYVSYPTASDETTRTTPSPPGQRVLAEAIASELRELGLTDAHVDGYGYVYATLEANAPAKATLGLIAHLDTSDEASGENIKARAVEYEGGDILLNGEKGIYMRESDYPYLKDYRGQRLIVTDGTTLLGADDKAGVCEIVSALEALIKSGAPHGRIRVAFTPDEEIGEGADHFDVEGFGADYAYTVDGGGLGELEYENFNAASAKIKVNGVSIHPGSAKNKMKNAARIAMDFNSLLTPDSIPERTEGYEGFHHLIAMEGGCESAELAYIIRDHDKEKFLLIKEEFKRAADAINSRYGEGTLELTLKDSYYNMKEKIDKAFYTVERALSAMQSEGITPRVVPIRGGTDGARLSFMGLPCPNLCTGGENFHSRFEFVSVDAMKKITRLLVRLCTDLVE